MFCSSCFKDKFFWVNWIISLKYDFVVIILKVMKVFFRFISIVVSKWECSFCFCVLGEIVIRDCIKLEVRFLILEGVVNFIVLFLVVFLI